ncbi:MAG: hypothetical protein IKW77_00460 [Salinivirgaceae bacterium]|nr:hypothetical protein [Salinivirgaceae bacterium]
MKTLRYILGMVLVAMVAACDDEPAFEKAKFSNINGDGQVTVEMRGDYYLLSWTYPEIILKNSPYSSKAAVGIYNVYAITATDTVCVATIYDAESAKINFDDVQKKLNGNTNGLKFGVMPSGFTDFDKLIYSGKAGDKVLIGASANPSMGYVDILGEGDMGMYTIGDEITLTAMPYEGFKFTKWSDGETKNPRTIIAETNIKLEALFEETTPLYRVYVWTTDENENKINAPYLIEINKSYVPLEDDNVKYQVAGAYEYGETAIITAKDGNGYQFVRWHDGSTENTRKFEMTENYVALTAIYKIIGKYDIQNTYQGPNIWFLGGDNKTTGWVEDKNINIKVEGKVEEDEDGIAAVWGDNFEIVLQGLANQIEKKTFQMKFDITWDGEKEEAYFRICSGADNYIEGTHNYNTLTKKEVWMKEHNTELEFDDFESRMGQTFSVVRGVVTPVEWGGKIGPKGEDGIGIEINLSGIDFGEEIYENGPGTFTISNMQILIDEKPVWE